MRRRLTAVILILMITFSIVSSEYLTAYAEGTKDGPTIKILFVGNSFTERNNLHKIFKGISKANGYKVKTKKLAYGGYKLRKYSSSKTKAGKKLRKLLKKDWDYVVIQGHSEEFVKSYNKNSYKAVSKIIKMVRKSGAEPILYMNWSMKDGMEYKERGKKRSLTREETTKAVSDVYYRLGNEFGVKVAPVGQNFLRCAEEYPDIKLYKSDDKHPKYAGSYLSACTIYETIFGKSVIGTEYFDTDEKKIGIKEENAVKLQQLADVRMSIDKSYMYMAPGGTGKVEAGITVSENNSLYMDKYYGKDVIRYVSLDPDIAEVDEATGEIKANNTGITYVRAESDSGLYINTTVEVKDREFFDISVRSEKSGKGDNYRNNIIRWNYSGNDDVFEVYRSIYNTNHFKRVYCDRDNYFVDKDMIKGRKYIYKVRAYKVINDELLCTGESTTRSIYVEKTKKKK